VAIETGSIKRGLGQEKICVKSCREVRELLLLLLFDSAIITRRSLTLGGAHMPLLR